MTATDSAEILKPGALDGAIRASRRLPYIYVQNWKCGCSTIKSTLWAAEHTLGLAPVPGHPHQQIPDYPFVNDPRRWEHADREFVFTFVRNPFTRTLSAYLDKIVRHRDPSVWGRFAARYGLGDTPPDFPEFLRLVAATPPRHMDLHWRPQCHTVAPHFIPYDFVGSMENFEDDLRLVLARVFQRELPVREHAPHRTDSSAALDRYYGPAEIDQVRRICAVDFQELGYGTDPANLRRTAPSARPDRAALRAWGAGCRHLEEGDLAAAAADLDAAAACVSGPALADRRLQCHMALLEQRGAAGSADQIHAILATAMGTPELWKRAGRAMLAAGRREAGLTALLQAVELRAATPRHRRRAQTLRRRLALARARAGRRQDALAALARSDGPVPFGHRLVDAAYGLAIVAIATCMAPFRAPTVDSGAPR